MKLLTIASLLGLALGCGSLTSCNTLYGMGEDLSHFGQKVAGSSTARGVESDLNWAGQKIDEAVVTDEERGYVRPSGQPRYNDSNMNR